MKPTNEPTADQGMVFYYQGRADAQAGLPIHTFQTHPSPEPREYYQRRYEAGWKARRSHIDFAAEVARRRERMRH